MQPRPAVRSLILLTLGVAVVSIGAVLVAAGILATWSRPAPESGAGLSPSSPASSAPAPSASPKPTSSPASSPGPSTMSSPSAAIPTPPGGDPVLVGAGDIGRCDSEADEATATLLEQTAGLVFTLGDNAYERGTEAELRNCYGPGWGRVLDRTRFAVAGNHDYLTANAGPFRDYFGRAGSRDGLTWFSEDVGTWHVVVLDANCAELKGGCGPDSAQLQWLRKDLATSTARCTLALWHQPRFSSGEHGNDPGVGPFWDALYAAGADLVLNGHDHDYERFAPQDPKGRADPDRGIVEVVVGTGGAPLRDFKDPAANAIVRSSIAHGVLVLALQPSGWTFRFVSTDGSFSDQGRSSCH